MTGQELDDCPHTAKVNSLNVLCRASKHSLPANTTSIKIEDHY